MPVFSSDGFSIFYTDEGTGKPVLLLHGFGSTLQQNWVDVGWTGELLKAGYRVIAFDHIGHGNSDAPHSDDAYTLSAMARHGMNLLDHLGIEQAQAIGFSMGARILARLLVDEPDLIEKAVFGGISENLTNVSILTNVVPDAMMEENPRNIQDPEGRVFRAFIDRMGQDRLAMAACSRSTRQPVDPADLAMIDVPCLVVAGDKDTLAGDATYLAAQIPGAKAVVIPGADHMKTTGHKDFKRAALEFLD